MSFKEKIEARENVFLKSLEECKVSGLKTYIWGNGEGAKNVEIRGEYNFDGKVVSKEYFQNGENDVFCLEDILERSKEKINLVVGFAPYDYSLIEEYKDNINILIDCDCVCGNLSSGSDLISYSFVEENDDKLEKIYLSLCDDKSKRTLIAYINQKISRDFKYLNPIYEKDQYFSDDIIKFNHDEVFLDCGAFRGETAECFVKHIKRKNVTYKKIISWEPDPVNYQILKGKGIKNHECLNLGCSDHKDIMRFSMKGSSSAFDANGTIKVEIDTVDNIMKDSRVSFIKMDIEGMELAALRGAKEVIKRNKPKLAICIYHKNEDLWEIQNYIQSIVPEYRFYIRAYEKYCIELVLYAVI